MSAPSRRPEPDAISTPHRGCAKRGSCQCRPVPGFDFLALFARLIAQATFSPAQATFSPAETSGAPRICAAHCWTARAVARTWSVLPDDQPDT